MLFDPYEGGFIKPPVLRVVGDWQNRSWMVLIADYFLAPALMVIDNKKRSL
jgi:hypothetical protein